jgi:hypothetical protein
MGRLCAIGCWPPSVQGAMMKETPTPESLRPGSVVGSWRIEGYAGRGSYGLVFRARRVGAPHSKPVALKMAAFAYDVRFLREGVWVERAGRAVLMDYGSCTWAGAPPLTETLMPPNTPEYRSPEALRFQWGNWRTQEARYEARPADDLYALGVSAYRLVTSVYPPPGTEPEGLKQHLETPPARRLQPQELKARGVPELAALIERMLAEEPEARGLARNAIDAAETAAASRRPDLDVPLWDPEHSQDGFAHVPARLVPASRSERLPAGTAPKSARAEPSASSRTLRPRLVFAAMVLALAGIWWMGPMSREQVPKVVQGTSPEAETPDSGNTGLGDGGVTARIEPQEEPTLAKTVAKQMPTKPLPDQRRAPCGRGEVEIRGGCWAPWITLTPPCGDEAYEWNGVCYWPLFKGSRRVPTSEDQQ